jgi:hypothetical protein
MTTEATTRANPQGEKKIPSIVPLVIGLVGLLVVIVGAFLYATVERMGDLNKPAAIFVVGLALIGVARVVQETRITARK